MASIFAPWDLNSFHLSSLAGQPTQCYRSKGGYKLMAIEVIQIDGTKILKEDTGVSL